MLSNTREQQLHSEADDQSEDFYRSYTYHSPRDNIDDNLSLDDAENPLQLLARASDLQLSPTEVRGAHKWPPSTIQASGMLQNSTEGSDPAAQSYFVPIRASLDVGPDIDPIDIGLVTASEAESLFSLYAQAVLTKFVPS